MLCDKTDGGLLSCSCRPQDASQCRSQGLLLLLFADCTQTAIWEVGYENTGMDSHLAECEVPPLLSPLLHTRWVSSLPSSTHPVRRCRRGPCLHSVTGSGILTAAYYFSW